jgi:hypothetical protein
VQQVITKSHHFYRLDALANASNVVPPLRYSKGPLPHTATSKVRTAFRSVAFAIMSLSRIYRKSFRCFSALKLED